MTKKQLEARIKVLEDEITNLTGKKFRESNENNSETEFVEPGNCADKYCNNGAIVGYCYCDIHKCKKSGCDDRNLERFGGDGHYSYCRDHLCSWEDCDDKRYKKGDLCRAHLFRNDKFLNS